MSNSFKLGPKHFPGVLRPPAYGPGSPYISIVCPIQDSRGTHPRSVSNQLSTITPAGPDEPSTQELDRRSGHLACWRKTLRIAFQLRRPELCLSISHQPTTLYGTATSSASYCDCYLTGIWSAWSWSWLEIAASPYHR